MARQRRPTWAPLDTFIREVNEELTLEKGLVSTLELRQLGIEPKVDSYKLRDPDAIPTKEDYWMLKEVKEAIIKKCEPFGDYIVNLPKVVLDQADPLNKHQGYVCIVSYWKVFLDEITWEKLTKLQEKFHNLSSESLTIITSLQEIVSTNIKTAFGHDRPLKDFFLSCGLTKAEKLPLVEGILAERIGLPRRSWSAYFQDYYIVRKPI